MMRQSILALALCSATPAALAGSNANEEPASVSVPLDAVDMVAPVGESSMTPYLAAGGDRLYLSWLSKLGTSPNPNAPRKRYVTVKNT